jgi:hypothetical protein
MYTNNFGLFRFEHSCPAVDRYRRRKARKLPVTAGTIFVNNNPYRFVNYIEQTLLHYHHELA